MNAQIGILGLGSALPECVRRNDWWPPAVVAEWTARQERIKRGSDNVVDPREAISRLAQSAEGEGGKHTPPPRKLITAEMARFQDDPFEGVLERRVLGPGERLFDLVEKASRDALDLAGVRAGEIDLVLSTHGQVFSKAQLQRSLGLPRSCMSVSTSGQCNEFLQQIALARTFVSTGRARFALLVQAQHQSPFYDPTTIVSTRFGDGATAAVVGPVGDGFGLLGQTHLTDGDFFGGFVVGVEGGKVVVRHGDPYVQARMLFEMPVQAKQLLERALAETKLSKGEVGFWTSHRPNVWMQSLLRSYCGVDHAAMVETFSRTGNLSGSTIPLSLLIAGRDGLLQRGTIVAMFAVAIGMTASCAILRWGSS